MKRLLAAALVVASAVCLYFALTRPIVISQMVSLNQMIRVIYPEAAYVPPAAKPAAPADASAPAAAPAPPQDVHALYEKAVAGYEGLIKGLVLKTDAAKQNFEALTSPNGYTAWQSSRLLYDAGDTLSATAIVAFSIVYPVAKTLALLVLIIINVRPKTALRLAELTHKYTMLDVFVAAVTVVAISTQPLLKIDTGPAIWWYVGYLVTGFAAVMVLAFQPKAQGGEAP